MAPRETENNAYAKLWGDKKIALWYVMVFSGVVNCLFDRCLFWGALKLKYISKRQQNLKFTLEIAYRSQPAYKKTLREMYKVVRGCEF